jgi:hypothetical protein
MASHGEEKRQKEGGGNERDRKGFSENEIVRQAK